MQYRVDNGELVDKQVNKQMDGQMDRQGGWISPPDADTGCSHHIVPN